MIERRRVLEEALAAVTVDRDLTHGAAGETLASVAAHWTWWIGGRLSAPLTSVDVAQMLIGLKQARAQMRPGVGDHYVDIAGYAALAAECASEQGTKERGDDACG